MLRELLRAIRGRERADLWISVDEDGCIDRAEWQGNPFGLLSVSRWMLYDGMDVNTLLQNVTVRSVEWDSHLGCVVYARSGGWFFFWWLFCCVRVKVRDAWYSFLYREYEDARYHFGFKSDGSLMSWRGLHRARFGK